MHGEKNVMRSVQITGKSTYIVSLPKSWVRETGLKKGDKLIVKQLSDYSLLIKPIRNDGEQGIEEIIIKPHVDFSKTAREIVAAYLSGASKIVLKVDRNFLTQVYELKKFVKGKLLGFEIIEETSDELVLQSLVDSGELPLKKVLERMWITAYYMVEDSLKALLNSDIDLADNVIDRDDEIDRFYFYANRQLKHAIEKPEILDFIGVNNPNDLLEYKSIIKTIERIADHATRIAKMVRRLKKTLPIDMISDVVKLKTASLSLFEYAMKALYNNDKNLAHRVLDSLESVQSLEKELTKKYILKKSSEEQLDPLEIMSLKLILDSLRRIAEYSSDISESILNLLSKR